MRRLSVVTQLVFIGGIALNANTGLAQDYPHKPIRIITNGAGGGADFVTRQVAAGITGPLGQPIVVDNRAGTVNAMSTAAKAPPDGYTALVSGSGLWTTPLFQKSFWDMERDYAPVCQISKDSYIMVAYPGLGVNSVQDLVALAKSKPGALNYGSASVGGPQQIGMELLKSMTGINIVLVSYSGTPAVITSILGGEVQVTISDPGLVLPHTKTGKLKALGVTSAQPSELAPGVPPVASQGLPGYEVVGATAMWVPMGTPTAIINRLNREVVRVVTQPDVKARLLASGAEVLASTPEQFAANIKADLVRVNKLIKDTGIKIQ